jgi:hypothetical protein
MFSFDDSPMADLSFADSPATVFERHNGSAKVDLNVLVVPRAQRQRTGERADGRITFLWEYSDDLFDESTVKTLAARYIRLLDGAIGQPDLRVDRLPMFDDGELDRPLDPAAKSDAANRAATGVAASAGGSAGAPEETALGEIWREVLGLGRVERDDDFFDLGGHSLLALQVVSRIRARLGYTVPVAALFDNPTVARLAAYLSVEAVG